MTPNEMKRAPAKRRLPHFLFSEKGEEGKPKSRQDRLREALLAGLPSPLTRVEHVCAVCEMQWDDDVPAWQAETLFPLLRKLKSHPDFAAVNGKEALRMVEEIICNWPIPDTEPRLSGYRQKAAQRWEHFFYTTGEDAAVAFLDGWARVRCAAGKTPLDEALERAKKTPINFAEEHLSAVTDGYKLFLNLAAWLQAVVGNRAIMLPVHMLAARLNVKPMTVSRYRQWAIHDNFLRVSRDARFHSKGGEATEFYFNVGRITGNYEKVFDPNILSHYHHAESYRVASAPKQDDELRGDTPDASEIAEATAPRPAPPTPPPSEPSEAEERVRIAQEMAAKRREETRQAIETENARRAAAVSEKQRQRDAETWFSSLNSQQIRGYLDQMALSTSADMMQIYDAAFNRNPYSVVIRAELVKRFVPAPDPIPLGQAS